MPDVLILEPDSAPPAGEYQLFTFSCCTLYCRGALLIERQSDALVFSNRSDIDSDLVQALLVGDNAVAFPLLNRLSGPFIFFVYRPAEDVLDVVSDRLGHFKWYYMAVPGGYRLTARLPSQLFGPDQPPVSVRALAEYFHYRWNYSDQSLFSTVRQIAPGMQVRVSAGEVVTAERYSRLFPAPSISTDDSNGSSVKELLLDALGRSLDISRPVTVLLSGGVDSALLLAMATEVTDGVRAVTPHHSGHPDPELERAVFFARQLEVEHEILEISDTEIADLFIRATRTVQQPLRHYSSLTLFRTFSSIAPGTQILYGEGADVLFGSAAVRNFKQRQAKIRYKDMLRSPATFAKLIARLPRLGKLHDLLNDTPLASMLAVNRLENDSPSALETLVPGGGWELVVQNFLDRYQLTEEQYSAMSPADRVQFLKQWVIDTISADHFLETGQMANEFGLQLVSPFMDWEVSCMARTLTDDEYFGSGMLKPLLRQLGAEYYGREMMELPKLSFPVPHESWLKHELSDVIAAAIQRYGVPSGAAPSNELDWTLAGFHVLDVDIRKL